MTTTPVLDNEGVLIATMGVSADISAQLRAEETSSRLSAIVDSLTRRATRSSRLIAMERSRRGMRPLRNSPASRLIGRHVSVLMAPDQFGQLIGIMCFAAS